MNKVKKQHTTLKQVALFLKVLSKWSVHAISCELNHSDSTTSNVLHGRSHNLEHYIDILSFLSRTNGWECNLSCVSGMVERTMSEGNVLVIGRKDETSGKILEVEKVFHKQNNRNRK